MRLPKILIAAPQHSSKMYCWDAWWNNVKSFTYPNFEVFISDNSPTKTNADFIRNATKDSGIKVTVTWKRRTKESLIAHINDSHNECRRLAIRHGFDYMLHLETDVIPPIDVIERLWVHGRAVCCGQYDIENGKRRKAMIQMIEQYDRTKTGFRVADYLPHQEPDFFDGTVQNVLGAGIGCALIKIDTLKLIKFRVVENANYHSDTWFAIDCYINRIPIFVDTTIQCDHLNSTWLEVADQLPGVETKK